MSVDLVTGAKKDLLDIIKRHGPLSIDEAVAHGSLAKTTVRQHLLQLEEMTLVKRSYRQDGGGRPSVVFEISPSGQRLFPNRTPSLFSEMLQFMDEHGSQSLIEQFFKSYWQKRAERFTEILASRDGRQDSKARMEALAQLLESEGFMPMIDHKKGTKPVLRECNCPFPEVVRVTRLPCRLESEFIKWAMKTPITRSEYILDGHSSCSYVEKEGLRSKPSKKSKS